MAFSLSSPISFLSNLMSPRTGFCSAPNTGPITVKNRQPKIILQRCFLLFIICSDGNVCTASVKKRLCRDRIRRMLLFSFPSSWQGFSCWDKWSCGNFCIPATLYGPNVENRLHFSDKKEEDNLAKGQARSYSMA